MHTCTVMVRLTIKGNSRLPVTKVPTARLETFRWIESASNCSDGPPVGACAHSFVCTLAGLGGGRA